MAIRVINHLHTFNVSRGGFLGGTGGFFFSVTVSGGVIGPAFGDDAFLL
jgi:hypothetical protein